MNLSDRKKFVVAVALRYAQTHADDLEEEMHGTGGVAARAVVSTDYSAYGGPVPSAVEFGEAFELVMAQLVRP